MICNGVDLVKVSRFQNVKDNKNLMSSLFNNEELDYIYKHFSIEVIAGLFALKEAFLKALKKGINNYYLKDILILHNLINFINHDFLLF